MHSIYFLKSTKNQRIYTGYTNQNPNERLKEHNRGSNEWTRNNGPFELIYFESYLCREDALLREKFYKTGFGRTIRNAVLSAASAIDACTPVAGIKVAPARLWRAHRSGR